MNVTEGTSAEAEEWRKRKYDFTNQLDSVYAGPEKMDFIIYYSDSVAAFDDYNCDFEYMLDVTAYFDRNRQVLYMQFAFTQGDDELWLRFEEGGCVFLTPGNGITEISYPFEEPPSSVEVWTEQGYFLNSFPLDVMEGTTAEAEKWLAQKYGYDSQMNEPSIYDTDISASIIGEWEYWRDDPSANGDPGLEKIGWIFNVDGTYDFFSYLCIPASYITDIFYDGQYWEIGASGGESGSYVVNGREIITQGTDYTFGEESTSVIPIEFFDGEVLCLGNREYRRAN